MRSLLHILLFLVSSTFAYAECLNQDEVKALVNHYPKQPVGDLTKVDNLADAYCTQQKYVNQLSQNLGVVDGHIVGYKVGFTGKAGQKKFGIDGPAFGVLMKGMLLKNNEEISADYGFRPMIEPDLMVSVKDDAIMEATNLMDVAKHLDMLHAFIEMPTIQFPYSKPFNGNQLVALNVAATKMVVGEGVKVQATEAFLNKLAVASTEFTDESGKMIQAAPLKNLMEHPFNAVLWLVKALKAHDKKLKKGDVISLGAVGKLYPLSNESKTYRYSIHGVADKALIATVKVKKY